MTSIKIGDYNIELGGVDPIKQIVALKLKAEYDKIVSETALNQQNNEAGRINVEAMQRQEKAGLAQDVFNQTYQFHFPVTEETVANCKERLLYWSRTKPGCNMEIVFTSPGGNLFEGLVLYDFIQVLKRPGFTVDGQAREPHHITTGVLGVAASMAGILLQAGSTRWMGAESWLMIHEMQTGAKGSQSEIEEAVALNKRMAERINNLFLSGQQRAITAGTAKLEKKFTKASLNTAFKKKDWWLSSDEALELGFIDEIR
jgi:ATP-dependent protease ClpP protease subunit